MTENKMVITDDLFQALPEEDKNSEFIAVAIKTFARDAWDRFRKNKLAVVGLIFLIVMILLAIFVPMFAPYKFDTQDMANRNALPSMQHLFGTDIDHQPRESRIVAIAWRAVRALAFFFRAVEIQSAVFSAVILGQGFLFFLFIVFFVPCNECERTVD